MPPETKLPALSLLASATVHVRAYPPTPDSTVEWPCDSCLWVTTWADVHAQMAVPCSALGRLTGEWESHTAPSAGCSTSQGTKWPQKISRRSGPNAQQESPFYVVCVHAHLCGCLQRPEEGVRSSRIVVTMSVSWLTRVMRIEFGSSGKAASTVHLYRQEGFHLYWVISLQNVHQDSLHERYVNTLSCTQVVNILTWDFCFNHSLLLLSLYEHLLNILQWSTLLLKFLNIK